MPHIIVEYTESLNLDWPKVLDALHSDLANKDTIDIHAIKTRSIPVKYSLVGDQHDRDLFIHITLKLLEGRDATLRRSMAESLHAIAKKHAHDDRIAVSVDVVEMNKDTYVK